LSADGDCQTLGHFRNGGLMPKRHVERSKEKTAMDQISNEELVVPVSDWIFGRNIKEEKVDKGEASLCIRGTNLQSAAFYSLHHPKRMLVLKRLLADLDLTRRRQRISHYQILNTLQQCKKWPLSITAV